MKQLFESKYTQGSRQDLQDFLSWLFGDKISYNTVHQAIGNQTLYFDNQQCYELAHIELDKEIAVYEIKQRSINDPRVTLTKDAFKLMQNKWVNNALIVFYSDDSSSWRLSLLTIKRGFWGTETSDHKRYSYLLGEWEKLKTPLQYLDKPIVDFKDLVSRFDVEVVRKEFFNHYLELYIRLYKAIKEDTDFVSILNKQNVELVSFTKNLLWKIIFLYFIQKKGWLWVPPGGTYGTDGDRNFMRNLWNDFTTGEHSVLEKKDFFYNDYLEWLFHAGLNKDNTDTDDFNEYFDKKVPFLNGWLFKEEYTWWRSHVCEISNDIFSNNNKDGILDIFDLYNFTIDEDDLTDSEMAVDPEMLWRIFEKMISISHENIDEILEAYEENKKASGRKKKIQIDNLLNKKFGAFYTPREIVHYMTKESLIAYLVNNLKGKREEKEKQVRDLFDIKDSFLVSKDDLKSADLSEDTFDRLWDIIQDIDVLLRKVKILDPAVWSWAFPMWVLHEISSIRYYIYWVFYKSFWVDEEAYKDSNGKISMYEIKKDIILNNIYGVDISPGAIDIARLRFWLSLVVDEETPEPLPNFEFKFVCANTLIPLAEEVDQSQLELHADKDIKVETLRKYMVSYYKAQSNASKQEWKERIEKLLGIGQNISMDLYDTKSERQKQLESYKPFDASHSSEFFDPWLMMGNSKFDIVIGNPPYGVSIKWDYRKTLLKVFDKVPDFEIYYYFIEIAYRLLKNRGVKVYIIPNTFLFNVYAEKYRYKLLSDWRINELLDCTQFEIFENATVRNAITLFSKDDIKNQIWYRNTNGIVTFNDLVSNPRKYLSEKNLDANSKNWWLAFKLDKQTIDLVIKIRDTGEKLCSFFPTISQWLIAYDKYQWQDESVIKSRAYHHFNNDDANYKKWLYGWDVSKYNLNWNWKEYIDYCKWIANPREQKFFNQARILVREITNPVIYATYTEAEFYNDPAIINILEWSLSLKFLLWVLNSKLITFYHFSSSPKATKWAFPKILVTDIKQFPIVKPGSTIHDNIVMLVDSIHKITKQDLYDLKNPPQEQNDLEKEIDDIVYELYGLSDDEVEIIESSIK